MLEMKEFAKDSQEIQFSGSVEKAVLQSTGNRYLPFRAGTDKKWDTFDVVQEEIFDDIQINVVTEPETWKNLTEFAEEEG